MIPKILHYCWFGTKQMSKEHQEYIKGWQQLMPDYKIIRWSEQNSPMHLPYLQNAIRQKKWANLSNFVRIYALYHHGGIYMDTDMEVLKPLNIFRKHDCFLGLELGDEPGVAPVVNNAIFGAIPAHPFVVKSMNHYLTYLDGRDDALDSSPYLTTRLLKEAGMYQYGRQNVDGVELYPKEYFYPYHVTEQFTPECVKENTYCIHRWAYSWGKKPFSWRLENLKQQTRQKIYNLLPVATKGRLKDGRLMGNLLKNGTVKAGPFKGVQLPVPRKYEANHLPEKLAGLYKEQLQLIIYRLTNTAYARIFYYGDSPDFFVPGIQALFPDTQVSTLSEAKLPDFSIKNSKNNNRQLLITNGKLARQLVKTPDLLPKNVDAVLEFEAHLSKKDRTHLEQATQHKMNSEYVNSTLKFQYEQNAFLEDYPLKEIERLLKRHVTTVHQWVVLRQKAVVLQPVNL